jgi:hypothetical protein
MSVPKRTIQWENIMCNVLLLLLRVVVFLFVRNVGLILYHQSELHHIVLGTWVYDVYSQPPKDKKTRSSLILKQSTKPYTFSVGLWKPYHIRVLGFRVDCVKVQRVRRRAFIKIWLALELLSHNMALIFSVMPSLSELYLTIFYFLLLYNAWENTRKNWDCMLSFTFHIFFSCIMGERIQEEKIEIVCWMWSQ